MNGEVDPQLRDPVELVSKEPAAIAEEVDQAGAIALGVDKEVAFHAAAKVVMKIPPAFGLETIMSEHPEEPYHRLVLRRIR